jgi:hypothetical protein
MAHKIDDDLDSDMDDLDGGEFEPEDDFESDDADVDLDGIDSGDDSQEEEPADRYSDVSVASAVRATPKRQQVRKKSSRFIEELFGEADLSKVEGQLAAWEYISPRMQTAIDEAKIKQWSLDVELHDEDVVTHKTFGTGFVIQLLTPTKAEVLFQDGLKKLVCGLKR